jgi:hypothetical protein
LRPKRPERHGSVEALGGKEERAQLSAVHASDLVGEDPRTADVLGRVRPDPAVNVGEAVEATDSRETSIAMVVGARPRSSRVARYNSMWPRVALKTSIPVSTAH